MKKLIFLLLCFSFSLAAKPAEKIKPEISVRTKRMARNFESEVVAGRLNVKAHEGLDALMRFAIKTLKQKGHVKEAITMEKEWSEQFRFLYIDMVREEGRHIGDHGAISLWLKEQMEKLTFLLGKELVYTLRLSDIRTFNETPKVCFRCQDNVDEMEYFLHLVHDEEVSIRGLGPTSAYWGTYAGCVAAGAGLVCGPIAMGVEWLCKSYIFPKLNEPLWKRACKQP